MIKMIDEMESIGDVIFAMSKVVDRIKEKKIKLNQQQDQFLNELFELILQAFVEMNRSLEKGFSDVNTDKAYLLETMINEKRDQIRQQHVEDLKEKKYKHKTGAYYGDLFSLGERIGDYILNVSEAFKEYEETA